MGTSIKRHDVQLALHVMAGKAREAREAWQTELTACREKGLTGTDGTLPASLAERAAHWHMAHLMLHIAVGELVFSGQNGRRVDRYVTDLITGERWPAET